MNLLVCCTLVPKECENKIEHLSNAANRFMMNIVKELRKENNVTVLSYISVKVDNEVLQYLKSDSRNRYICCTDGIRKGVKEYWKMLKRCIHEYDCVIVYNPVYVWLYMPILAKRHGIKSMIILADYSPAISYRKIICKIYAYLQLKSIQTFDIVVGLSKNIEKYTGDKQQFICIEGGIDQSVYDFFCENSNHGEQRNKSVTRFMYSGILEQVTGVDLLLEAFSGMNGNDKELWISGKGSLYKLVSEYTKKDLRIHYLGMVRYEEYLEKLKKADVLINPRNMNLPENENNFPSKIMEYISTGKTIVSTRFPGWEKFDSYVIFCDSTVSDIRDKMMKAAGMSDTKHNKVKLRRLAKEYLWEKQVKKLISLIREDFGCRGK